MNEKAESKKIKCLIVEDNFHATDIMKIYFSRNNIDSDAAENGQIGLQMYLQNPGMYDVIFCDLQMPVMDGHEMTRLIRSSGQINAETVPIVAMSGTITESVLSRESFTCLLRKPFELSSLLTTISDVTKDK